MTDLALVLPSLSTASFANVLPSLERAHITTADLLLLDPLDAAKHAQIPVREVRRLLDAVVPALQHHLALTTTTTARDNPVHHPSSAGPGSVLDAHRPDLPEQLATISLLDDGINTVLDGGVPTGYLTEFTGESGAGKTQFLLTLLLSVQLPPSHGGIAKSALYISTESALQTSRLAALLAHHPTLAALPLSIPKPTLSAIHAITVPDLEAQEHILRYQLPVAIARHNIGLVVLDSITGNFRAEFDHRPGDRRAGPAAMARRSSRLTDTGAILRAAARDHSVAVVVANQVADRFSPHDRLPPTTPLSQPTPPDNPVPAPHRTLTLDHQQRWFTGWGDTGSGTAGLKTPSLGLVWTNQLACRIALTRRMVRTPLDAHGRSMRWQRRLRVVFSAWTADVGGQPGLEFEIGAGGVKSVAVVERQRGERAADGLIKPLNG